MSLPFSATSAIYLGIVVLDDIQNRQRYEQAIKEISLFLKTHNHEINLEIDERWVRLRSLEGQSEVNIPVSCAHLRTIYYRISMESVEDENNLRRFCEITWECCCILKENFPSRIELFQENLDQFVNVEEETFQNEMLRRQTNSLLNKLALQEQLKRDEIQDIFVILENSINLKNLKGIKACLELLESDLCPPCLLQQIHQNDVELLESIDSSSGALQQSLESELLIREYSDIRQLASSILCKILQAQNNGGAQFEGSKENLRVMQNLKKFEISNFSQPTSKHSYLFQLKETSDIERITFILDALLLNNLNLLVELDQIGLPKVVNKLLIKYSNGEFGIDFSEVTQYCVFHNRILKYLLRWFPLPANGSSNSPVLDPESTSALLQIIEEGVLNILKNTVNLDTKEKYEKELFLKQTLEFYQALLAQTQLIPDNFKRLLRTHIISVRDITNSYLGIGLSDDLSTIPRDFRYFYAAITALVDKVDYSLPTQAATTISYPNNQSINLSGKNINDNLYLNFKNNKTYQHPSQQKLTSFSHSTPLAIPKDNFTKNENLSANINLPKQIIQKESSKNTLQKRENQIDPGCYSQKASFTPNSDNINSRNTILEGKLNPFLPRQTPLGFQLSPENRETDNLNEEDELFSTNLNQDQYKANHNVLLN